MSRGTLDARSQLRAKFVCVRQASSAIHFAKIEGVWTMILRVRLQDLTIDLGARQIDIPSMPDTVFTIPDEPVSAERVFEGKQLLTHPLEPMTIKWGFRGAVAYLQKQLLDDP